MKNEEIKKTASKEKAKLKKILKTASVSQPRQRALEPVIENISWMKAKLDDARELIKSTHIVVPYDNGGGQKGIRQNPAFKAYENLWRSYIAGVDRILSALPDELHEETPDESGAPKNVLEFVLAKHQREA